MSHPSLHPHGPVSLRCNEKLVKFPFAVWIAKMDIEVTNQRCSNLAEFHAGQIATRTSIVA